MQGTHLLLTEDFQRHRGIKRKTEHHRSSSLVEYWKRPGVGASVSDLTLGVRS